MDNVFNLEKHEKVHITMEELHLTSNFMGNRILSQFGTKMDVESVNEKFYEKKMIQDHLSYRMEDRNGYLNYLSTVIGEEAPFEDVVFIVMDNMDDVKIYEAIQEILKKPRSEYSSGVAVYLQLCIYYFTEIKSNFPNKKSYAAYVSKELGIPFSKLMDSEQDGDIADVLEEGIIKKTKVVKASLIPLSITYYFFHWSWAEKKVRVYKSRINLGFVAPKLNRPLQESYSLIKEEEMNLLSEWDMWKVLEIMAKPDEVAARLEDTEAFLDVMNVDPNQITMIENMYTELYLMENLYLLHYIKSSNTLTRKIVKRKVGTSKKGGSAKNKKGKKASQIRFTTIESVQYDLRTISKLSNEELHEIINRTKRAAEYLIAKWGVRGHWREYKDGKRVWIKPQVRKRQSLSDDGVEDESVHHKHYKLG